ncbi:hypothetical protein Tco_0154385 [Tanacetum coccineum]
MNEDYYHEQNSCYDLNSFGFDQVQPPQYTVNHPIFKSQNDLLNSQNKLMEQMTTLRDLVGQVIQKKEEEKRIAEEQAAEDRYWKIPICYDDDEDDTIAITPVLPIEEPVNSLSMGDKHLDTIPETESDEFIKSSVEDLVPIPSESEALHKSSSDDDSTYGEDIEYVDASPPDVEIVSLEVVDIVDPEAERINDDILLTIKDDILREKIPNLECFKFKIDPDPGDLDSIDLGIRKNVSTTNVNVPLEDDQSSLSAYVDFPDCEDSRAYGFHILNFILGIEYPNLID